MYEKPGRRMRGLAMRLGPVAGVGLALALAGCSADYVEDGEATVLLIVSSINAGSPIASDVRGDDGQIVNCPADIGVTALVKNPNNPGGPGDTVVLRRYDVTFSRSDGRGVEGVDVPYRFSAPMTATLEEGEEVLLSIDLVRQQAKLEPPLSNITGLAIVEMTAHVTVFGETVSHKSVSASGVAAIRFADYGTGTTTCETGSSGGR
jgi:hypothetical protein